ncbi:50S ribosomal protein L10 [Mycoplasmoides pirum]|uniref:50S ribosomal protein L10 n=1 Tax=Mycoplasmoides pirum TaxID=2122 RepID=UPI00048165B3|nr:50S ribosomal protein L10 [Mycoplasmoides pirum]
MKAVIQAKIDKINEIANILSTAKSFVIFEYSTMTALETTELRRSLTQAGNKMFVLKNNIVTRALSQSNIEVPSDKLIGQIAIAFGIEDGFQPIKAIHKFVKEKDKVNFRVGFLEGKVLEVNELNQIALLPSRDELYSMFLSVLQAPLRKFMYAMKAVGDKK